MLAYEQMFKKLAPVACSPAFTLLFFVLYLTLGMLTSLRFD